MVEIDRFLTHLQENEDLAQSTLAGYRVHLGLFGRWLDGHRKTLATLTTADMRQYRDELKAKYKPGTVNKKLIYASAFLKWCVGSGHIRNNPLAKIKYVREQSNPKWLTHEQLLKLLASTETAVNQAKSRGLDFATNLALKTQAIVRIMLNTGLRVSELCDLQLSDIQNGVIVVRWGKGSKRREVPMNDQAQAALQAWLKVRRSESDYIFTTPAGRMTRQIVQWHFSQISKRVGFRITPHLLRHTFGKMLADKGIALDKIAKLMGHANINTTAIYTQPSLADLANVVKLLD